MIIHSQAPCRISLVGGGTDVNPYAAKHGGKVFSFAVNLYTKVTLKPHPGSPLLLEALGEKRLLLDFRKPLNYQKDPKFDLIRAILNHFRKDMPSGFKMRIEESRESLMGLGSSGSAAVAVIAALSHWLKKNMTPLDMARLAYDLETKELKWPGGKQDQFAAALGGFNVFDFGPGHQEKVFSLDVPKAVQKEFRRWIFMIYVGGYRHSKEQQKVLVKKMKDRDRLKSLHALRDSVDKAVTLFSDRDWTGLGRILHQSWLDKKKSNNVVSNEWIDRMYTLAREQGAIGGKISGSGGAGHMFFICPPQKLAKVQNTLIRAGAIKVPFDFANSGIITKATS